MDAAVDEWQQHADAGKKAYDEAHYAEAERQFRVALRVAEGFATSDPRLAASLNNLAAACRAEAKFREAETIYKRLLSLRRQLLGQGDPKVAETLNELAMSYQAEHRFSQAERLQKQALAIREKAFGPEHLAVAESLNNLGALYYFEGRYGSTVGVPGDLIPHGSLTIPEGSLGVITAGMLPSSISGPYARPQTPYRQSKYAEAEKSFRRSLAIQDKLLAPDDGRRSAVLFNLASVSYSLQKWAAAEMFFGRLIAIQEKTLSEDDPKRANSLQNLALVYYAEGKRADGDAATSRTLALRERSLGRDSVKMAVELNNVAVLQNSVGNPAQAESLFLRSLAILERNKDGQEQHVKVLENFAEFLRAAGRPGEARQRETEAAKLRQTPHPGAR